MCPCIHFLSAYTVTCQKWRENLHKSAKLPADIKDINMYCTHSLLRVLTAVGHTWVMTHWNGIRRYRICLCVIMFPHAEASLLVVMCLCVLCRTVGVYNLKSFDLSLTLGRFPSLKGSFSSVYHNTFRLNAIGQKKASTYFLAITIEIHIIRKERRAQVRHTLFNIWTIGATDANSAKSQVKRAMLVQYCTSHRIL